MTTLFAAMREAVVGPKPTFLRPEGMSAFDGKADIIRRCIDVRP